MKTVCLCLLALPALLLSACGPSSADILAERRGAGEAKLQKIDKAGKDALSYVGKPGKVTLPDGEKLKFYDGRNAAMLQTEEFAEGDGREPSLDLILESMWLSGARELLSVGAEGAHPDYVRDAFDMLDSLKYLVLVRTRMFAAPSASNDEQFSPGWWEGEVLVYEIDSAKCVGMLSLEATNSDVVNANMDDPDKWLHSDLWSNARKALTTVLEPHAEGGVLK